MCWTNESEADEIEAGIGLQILTECLTAMMDTMICIDDAQGPAMIVHQQEDGKSEDDTDILVQCQGRGHGLLDVGGIVEKDMSDADPVLRPPLHQKVRKIGNIRGGAKDVNVEVVRVVRERKGKREGRRRRRRGRRGR